MLRSRKTSPRLRFASRLWGPIASGLALVLVLDILPSEVTNSGLTNGPSLASLLSPLGFVGGPLGSAARAFGSWFNSTFLTAQATSSSVQSPSETGEIPWKRTATSRTIQNQNRSYRTEIFSKPINYRDVDGRWQPIDNTLVTSTRLGYAWKNKANSFQIHLKSDIGADTVALVLEGKTYTITPQDFSSAHGSKDGNSATYFGVAPSTDLEWLIKEDGLKETLLLKGPSAPSSFRFLFKTPAGVKVAPEKDGSATARDGSGNALFSFDAPWAKESLPAGSLAAIDPSNRHASLSVKEAPGGYELTVAVDSQWLNQPERRFPIVVDPPVTIGPSTDGYVALTSSGTCSTGNCIATMTDNYTYAATSDVLKARTLMKFNVEGSVPWNSSVLDATLTMWREGCIVNSNSTTSCSTHAENIDVHRLTGPWNPPTDTWNVMDSRFSSTVEDTVFRPAAGDYTQVSDTYTLTALVQGWVKTSFPNYGLLLKHRLESYGQGGPGYVSSRWATSSQRPKLAITYVVNATHGYPPAAPAPVPTQVDLGNSTSDDATSPLLPPGPSRSLFRTSDGALVSIDNEGCNRNMQAATAPYQTWTAATNLGCDVNLQAFMRTDDNGTFYTIQRDTLNRGVLKRWTRSGTTTTWTNAATTVFETALPTAASVTRLSSGRIWVAYSKILVGDTTPTLVLRPSDDNGANFGTQTNLVRSNSAQLVDLGSGSAGIILERNSDGHLAWRSSTNWAAQTVFAEALATTDPYQAVVDNQGQVHLVYQTGGGIRYRMRTVSGTWTPAPGSLGTLISSTSTQPSLTSDGTALTLVATDSAGNIVRYVWNGSWAASTITVPAPDPVPFSHANIRGAVPERHALGGILPYLWEDKDFCSPCSFLSHFDYLDQVAPAGSMNYPNVGDVMVGTITTQASPVDEAGLQRVDFFVDRGGGLLGFLGSDSTPGDGFTYLWNTKELDGSSQRMWPDGAYRVYAVGWDYKSNRGETDRPLSYVQTNDLGIRPYRPAVSVSIGAGVSAQVNLWNGNLTVTHAMVSDPTVIGPLSINRTYNSQDNSNGTAGLGWRAHPDVDAQFSFSKLVNHATDPVYPQNVVELDESNGTPHFYQLTSGRTYAPFIDDFSVLERNGDGSWILILADGSRYTFDSTGNPVDYRSAPQSLDQPSFAYTYVSGKLSSVVDPVGRGFTLSYDANGRLGTVTSNQVSPARSWGLTYNTTNGELTDVTDPVNTPTTHFTYDSVSKLMTQVTTPAGVRVQFSFDNSSPPKVTHIKQLHTVGATTFIYDTRIDYVNLTTTKVIRPKGNLVSCDAVCQTKYTTTYGLDTRYRIASVQITLPDGTTKTKAITWNNQNRKTSETDFSGHQASATYDMAGNVLTQRDPIGNVTTHRYDEPYHGLQGYYYNDTALTPPAVLRRLDPQVSFNWGTGSPGPGVNAQNFSVRWAGYLNVPTSGVYTFYTTADDGSWLYLDGREQISNWTNPVQSEVASASVSLVAGLHPIVLESFQSTGSASISLSWKGPGISKQVIPSANLAPGFNLETSRVNALNDTTNLIYEDELPPNYYNDQDAFYGRALELNQTNVPVGGSSQMLRTTYTYNSYGQVLTRTTPNGNTGPTPDPANTVTYTYYGAAESATDPCTGASYPQKGLAKSVTRTGLAVITQFHDGAGNLAANTDGRGTTCATYDALGRMLSQKAPDRATPTVFTYNNDGQLATSADPLLPGIATYTYDDLDRLATAKDALAGTGESAVTYSYDEHGNVSSRSDKTGTYTNTIDERDAVTRVTAVISYPISPRTDIYTFKYDADGKLTQQDLPTGQKTLAGYDNGNRLTTYSNQSATGTPLANYTYTHDAAGRRLTEDGPDGMWAYSYDDLGRLEQAHDPTTGRTRRYTFDLDSNRTSVQLNSGWNTQKVANGYGTLVGLVLQPSWTGDDATFRYTTKFPFPFAGSNYTIANISTNGFLTLGSDAGAVQTIDLFTTGFKTISPYNRDLKINRASTANPGRGIYVEDGAGNSFVRIRWQAETKDATPIAANFEVTLYPSGQIKFHYQTLPNSGTSRVGVSPGNQLDFVAVSGFDRTAVPSNAQSVILTPAAVSTQASYTYNPRDQLTAGTGLSGIAYSSDGDQNSITGPSPRGAWTFSYDGRHLMTQAASGATSTTWTLDGENRVAKTVVGSTETRQRYLGPGDTSGWEEDATGTITNAFATGPGGLLATYSSIGTPTYYLTNGHGDVVQTRDTTGGLIQVYSYDENGNPISAQSPSKFGYVGRWQKEREPNSSLIRMGVRMYDPLTGRFTSTDPVPEGSLNSYDYAGDDPINHNDLTGLCWGWCQLRFAMNLGPTMFALMIAHLPGLHGRCRWRGGMMIECLVDLPFDHPFTIGSVILHPRRASTTWLPYRTVIHEQKHADQWAIFGWRFAYMYLADYVVQGECNFFEWWAGYRNGGYTNC